MTAEELLEKFRQKRHERIRRVKKLMRPLPRRSNVHRYPFLKWFAQTARARSYLWSFRRQHIISAIYIGCILSMLPIYGIQVPLAFILSLFLRCNLMIMIATQFITNPVTAVPLYTAACFLGLQILYLLGYDIPGGSAWEFAGIMASNLKAILFSVVGNANAQQSVNALVSESGMSLMKLGYLAFISTVIGGAIIGYFIGFIFSCVYQGMAKYYASSHRQMQLHFEKLHPKLKLGRQNRTKPPQQPDDAPSS